MVVTEMAALSEVSGLQQRLGAHTCTCCSPGKCTGVYERRVAQVWVEHEVGA